MLAPRHSFIKRPIFAALILKREITAGRLSMIKRLHGFAQAANVFLVAAIAKLPKSVDGDLHAVGEVFYFITPELSGIAEIDYKLAGVDGQLSDVFPATPPNCVAKLLSRLLINVLLVLAHCFPSEQSRSEHLSVAGPRRMSAVLQPKP
jgi:hypothetical protein